MPIQVRAPKQNAVTPEACRAASQLGRVVSRALDDADLTPAGYRLLAYLSSGEVAAKTLAAKLAVSRPTVTSALDWLEPRGFAVRRADSGDRRRLSVSITPRGRKALEQADALVASRLSTVLTSIADDELRRVISGLELVNDAINEHRSRTVINSEVVHGE